MAHGKFEFKGTGIEFLWLAIWTSVLTTLTLGIFGPWAYSSVVRWMAEKTFIDGKQLCFKGTGGEFFGTYLMIVLLTIITLGIYAPWGGCRMTRWLVDNLYFADPGDVEKA